jgi:hypothetical protein
MPKGILEFNLPEEENEFNLASNSRNYYSALWEIDQFLRSKVKYANDSVSEDTVEAYLSTREELWRILEEQGIDLTK